MNVSDKGLMAPESIYSSEQAGKKMKCRKNWREPRVPFCGVKKALCGFGDVIVVQSGGEGKRKLQLLIALH